MGTGRQPGSARNRGWVLLAVVAAVGIGLALWKRAALDDGDAAPPEMPETISAVKAQPRAWQPATTAIGTVVALRSVALRNEVPGTVARVALDAGSVAEAGMVLLKLDTRVEEAELAAQQAEVARAGSQLERVRELVAKKASSLESLEQAQAEHAVLQAQVERTRAVIERKVLRAPFKVRIGLADVHPGQYLEAGTLLTTLQGVETSVYIDFAVAQQVASGLEPGSPIEVVEGAPVTARVLAIDSRIDPQTRNAMIRARVEGTATNGKESATLRPGASVRVRIPSAAPRDVLIVPSSALRRGPEGDHLFVIVTDASGAQRAQLRRVRVGPVLGDETVIEAGLKAGDTIATNGSFKLRDNALVAIAAPSAPIAARAAAPVAGQAAAPVAEQ